MQKIIQLLTNKIISFTLIMRYSIKQFFLDDCIYKASALTFTTILSLVPLLSVSFTILKAFPQFNLFANKVQKFIFDSFIIEQGKVAQNYLQQFVEHTAELSSLGILFLIITAVMMLFTIEGSLNQIWRVKERRHGISAFLMYWAILTLIPFLLAASLAISSYFISLPIYSGATDTLGLDATWYLSWLPTICAFTIFLILYIAVPNIKVRNKSGLLGATIACVLFLLSKWGFALYLQQYSSYNLLYGAFATIPIFLIWLYIIWLIVLFGAEICHAASIGKLSTTVQFIDSFTLTLIWLKKIWAGQNSGKLLSLHNLTDQEEFRYELTPIEQLNILLDAQLIRLTTKSKLLISCDLHLLTLADLYDILPFKFPSAALIPNQPDLAYFKQVIFTFEESKSNNLNHQITKLLQV